MPPILAKIASFSFATYLGTPCPVAGRSAEWRDRIVQHRTLVWIEVDLAFIGSGR